MFCIRYCSNKYCRATRYCVCNTWRHWPIWYLYQAKNIQAQWVKLSLNGGPRWPMNALLCVFSNKICRAASFPKTFVTIMSLAKRKKLPKSILQNMCYTWNISTMYPLSPIFLLDMNSFPIFLNKKEYWNNLQIAIVLKKAIFA